MVIEFDRMTYAVGPYIRWVRFPLCVKYCQNVFDIESNESHWTCGVSLVVISLVIVGVMFESTSLRATWAFGR